MDCETLTTNARIAPSGRMKATTESLWERYRAGGDQEARRELLEQHLGLVHHTARQVARRVGREVELDELVSAGTLGLITAVERFDPTRGLAFATFATPRIRGAVLDELRGRDWIPRSVRAKSRKIDAAMERLHVELGRAPEPSEVATALGIDLNTYWSWRKAISSVFTSLDAGSQQDGNQAPQLDEMLADPHIVQPDAALTQEEEAVAVRQAIDELSSQERIVLALYYYEELLLREIAELLNLTESRISQIRSEALKRVRARVQLDQ